MTRQEFLKRLRTQARADGLSATYEEDDVPVFRPIDDQVLVRRAHSEPASRLVVPDRAKEHPLVGEVLAVGPGACRRDGSRQPMPVAPGQVVAFGKYAGEEVELDGTDCLVLRAADLLGVIEP